MAKLLVKRNIAHRLVEDDQQNAAQQPQQQQQGQQQPAAQNGQQPAQQGQQGQQVDITGTVNTYLVSMFSNIQNDLKTNFIKQVPAVSEAFKNAQSPLNQAAKALNDSYTAFTNIQGLKPEDSEGISKAIEAFSKFLSGLTEFSKQASQQAQQQQGQQQNGQQQNAQQQNQQGAQNNGQQPAQNNAQQQQANAQQPANNQQQNGQQQGQQPQQESFKPSFGEILNENLKYAQFGEMFADITTRYNNL